MLNDPLSLKKNQKIKKIPKSRYIILGLVIEYPTDMTVYPMRFPPIQQVQTPKVKSA